MSAMSGMPVAQQQQWTIALLQAGKVAEAKEIFEGLSQDAHPIQTCGAFSGLVTPFLATKRRGSYDAVLSADVFIYIGDLDHVFEAVSRCLVACGPVRVLRGVTGG